MTIQLDLAADVQTWLEERARMQGRPIEEYLRTIIEQMAALDTDEAWEADMLALSEGSERIPVLPSEAFSRASIYGDHD